MTTHRWECNDCKMGIANGKGGIILPSAEVRKYDDAKKAWDKANPGTRPSWAPVDLISIPHPPKWYPIHWDCSDGDHTYEIAIERVRTSSKPRPDTPHDPRPDPSQAHHAFVQERTTHE